MPRYKLTIAYDGTDFCGWQKQFPHADAVPGELTRFREDDPPVMGVDEGAGVVAEELPDVDRRDACPTAGKHAADGRDASPTEVGHRPRTELRTVQAVVERAVRLTVRQPVHVRGASRTDSGVHARGQVCSFTTVERASAGTSEAPKDGRDAGRTEEVEGGGPVLTNFERFGGGWPAERGCDALVRALNARLPADVLCRSAEVVADDFDPISGAKRKAYSYTIWNSTQRALWDRRNALHVWHPLDVRRMNEAAQVLVGEHDFAGFAAAGHGRLTTVRTVFSCAVRAERVTDAPNSAGQAVGAGEVAAQRIVIDVSGNGFLWNMVRIIAGTLMEAGKGKMGPERIAEALRTGDRNLAGPTAPAHGLCLEWIQYA